MNKGLNAFLLPLYKLLRKKYATKSRVDEGLAGKVDKNTAGYLDGTIQLYGKDQENKQSMFVVAQGTSQANTIVRRKQNGAIVARMSDDTTESEVATKSYVDTHSGGGTQLYSLSLNYGSNYGEIITIMGIGNNFFDLQIPNADALSLSINTNVLKIMHKDKLVSSITSSGGGNYINVDDTLTINYMDGTTATFTVTQIADMGGYQPLN